MNFLMRILDYIPFLRRIQGDAVRKNGRRKHRVEGRGFRVRISEPLPNVGEGFKPSRFFKIPSSNDKNQKVDR